MLPKILVLEDDDLDFCALERHMGSYTPRRYELLHAATIDEARRIVKETDISAALVDYSLPGGVTGLEFIDELGGRNSPFPSILLTGLNDDKIDEKAILIGAYDYIDKLSITRDLVDRAIRFAISTQDHERRLRASLMDAETQANLNRDILAVVSHEMQSPVGSLISYCDHIAKTAENDETRDAVKKMEAAAVHLEDFLRNISEYIRLDSGSAQLIEESFHLRDLIEETVQFFAPLATHKDITIETEITSTINGLFFGDAVRIRQILINILKNAVNYTDAGTIRVNASVAGDTLRVAVADSGVGMTADLVSSIVDNPAQWRRPSGQLTGGLGMGLSISTRLLELMNGTFILESTPGNGTMAGFEIPTKRAVDDAA